MEAPGILRRLIKPALGLGLVIALLAQLQLSELRRVLESAQWSWAVLAFVLACSANLTCALRWRAIVTQLDQPLTAWQAITLYFQGVTTNTVLPGGIIGGDVWRTLGLSKIGMTTSDAARSVLLDRASGFWALSFIALGAFLLHLGIGERPEVNAPTLLQMVFYALILIISMAPLVLWKINPKLIRITVGSAAISVISQALTIAAFVCCLLAVQAEFSILAVTIFCAGIFLAAVVPASIGGFGSRELASVFFLTAVGIQSETAFLGSVLFGLTATAQGLLSLPSWRSGEREKNSD